MGVKRRPKQPIRIGTRGSPLALWQAAWVERALRHALPDGDFVQEIVRTTGDIRRTQPLRRFAGFGVFTRELDTALLEDRIDLAVHSAKDYPTDVASGLRIAAFPCREVPNDSLVSHGRVPLRDLPEGAVIGTGSLRRSAQLASLRPDLRFQEIRGNIETRLRKVDEGQFDAIIMAEAALRRLQIDTPREVLPVTRVVPAAGEGALMIVCRAGDQRMKPLLSRIDSERISRCVMAERMVLLGLGGGCRLPIGVYGRIVGDTMRIRAVVLSPDGQRRAGTMVEGLARNPTLVAEKAVRVLLETGGREIIEDMRKEGQR